MLLSRQLSEATTVITDGSTITGTGAALDPLSVTNGGIGTTQLADGSVTNSKLASGAVATDDSLTGDGTAGAPLSVVSSFVSPKPSARFAPTTALPTYVISGGGSTMTMTSTGALSAQDGVTARLEDIFFYDQDAQDSGVDNGLWQITTLGASGIHMVAQRISSLAVGAGAMGAITRIAEGTTRQGQEPLCITDEPNDIVGTDILTWEVVGIFGNLSTTTPHSTGTSGAVGTGTTAARADHIHATGAGSVGNAALASGAVATDGSTVTGDGTSGDPIAVLSGGITNTQLASGAALANIGAGGLSATYLASGAALSNIGAGGVTSTYLASGAALANIGAGGITSTYLASGAVTAAKLASGAALSNIGAGGVTSTYLASGAALSNIGAGGVTATYLASGAALSNIGAGGVTATYLASGSVTNAALASGAVATDGSTTSGDGTSGTPVIVRSGGITSTQLASASVTNAKLASGAVATDGTTITGDGTSGDPLIAVSPGPDTTSIARDGSRPPTASQPWNSQTLTGVRAWLLDAYGSSHTLGGTASSTPGTAGDKIVFAGAQGANNASGAGGAGGALVFTGGLAGTCTSGDAVGGDFIALAGNGHNDGLTAGGQGGSVWLDSGNTGFSISGPGAETGIYLCQTPSPYSTTNATFVNVGILGTSEILVSIAGALQVGVAATYGSGAVGVISPVFYLDDAGTKYLLGGFNSGVQYVGDSTFTGGTVYQGHPITVQSSTTLLLKASGTSAVTVTGGGDVHINPGSAAYGVYFGSGSNGSFSFNGTRAALQMAQTVGASLYNGYGIALAYEGGAASLVVQEDRTGNWRTVYELDTSNPGVIYLGDSAALNTVIQGYSTVQVLAPGAFTVEGGSNSTIETTGSATLNVQAAGTLTAQGVGATFESTGSSTDVTVSSGRSVYLTPASTGYTYYGYGTIVQNIVNKATGFTVAAGVSVYRLTADTLSISLDSTLPVGYSVEIWHCTTTVNTAHVLTPTSGTIANYPTTGASSSITWPAGQSSTLLRLSSSGVWEMT